MPTKSKKVPNPEYQRLDVELSAARRTSKLKGVRMNTADKAMNDANREVAKLEVQLEKAREKLSKAVDHASECLSDSQDATAEVNRLIDELKETPKTIAED